MIIKQLFIPLMSYYQLSKKPQQIKLDRKGQLKINRITQAIFLKNQILLICQSHFQTYLLIINIQSGLSQKHQIKIVDQQSLRKSIIDCVKVISQTEKHLILAIKTEFTIFQLKIDKQLWSDKQSQKFQSSKVLVKNVFQHMNTSLHLNNGKLLYCYRQNPNQLKIIKFRKNEKAIIEAQQPIVLPISYKNHISIIGQQVFYFLPHLQKHSSFSLNKFDIKIRNLEKEVYTLACIRNNLSISTIQRVKKDSKIVILANYMDCKKYLVWVYDLKMGYSTNLLQYDSTAIKFLSINDEGCFQILEQTESDHNSFQQKVYKRNQVRRFNIYESQQNNQKCTIQNLDQILISDELAIFGVNNQNKTLLIHRKIPKKHIYRLMLQKLNQNRLSRAKYLNKQEKIANPYFQLDLVNQVVNLL